LSDAAEAAVAVEEAVSLVWADLASPPLLPQAVIKIAAEKMSSKLFRMVICLGAEIEGSKLSI
jgi:hypothetical protein